MKKYVEFVYQEENERLNNIINEKEKEIQDLKQKNDYLNDLEASAVEYKELQKETKRLNNIINELEKEIYNVVDKMNNSLIEIEGRGYYYQDLLPLECLIYKLKELKEKKYE